MKKKLLIIFGVCLTGFFLNTTDCFGATTTREFFEDNGDSNISIYNDDPTSWTRKAQTFTATTTAYTLWGHELWIRKVDAGGMAGNIIVGIKAVDGGGQPTGDFLASTSKAVSTLNAAYRWETFLYGTGYNLTGGTSYAIVVLWDDYTDNNNYIDWYQDTDGGYSGGNAQTSLDKGASWANNAGKDFYFENFGEDIASGGATGSTDFNFPELFIVIIAVFLLCLMIERGTGFLNQKIENWFAYKI